MVEFIITMLVYIAMVRDVCGIGYNHEMEEVIMTIKIFKGRKVRHKVDDRLIIVRTVLPNYGDDVKGFRGVYANKVTGRLEEAYFVPEEVKGCA